MTDHVPAGLREEPAPPASPREVIAAWIVVIMLLLGTGVSFALDHMVTVSDRTDWSSLSTTAGGASGDQEEGFETTRELRDYERR